jgi:hypothetical protein
MGGSTEIGPMVAVRHFVDGFNKDDVDLMQAACVDETSIIDDFPPHEWGEAERRRPGIGTWPGWQPGMACPIGR